MGKKQIILIGLGMLFGLIVHAQKLTVEGMMSTNGLVTEGYVKTLTNFTFEKDNCQ